MSIYVTVCVCVCVCVGVYLCVCVHIPVCVCRGVCAEPHLYGDTAGPVVLTGVARSHIQEMRDDSEDVGAIYTTTPRMHCFWHPCWTRSAKTFTVIGLCTFNRRSPLYIV